MSPPAEIDREDKSPLKVCRNLLRDITDEDEAVFELSEEIKIQKPPDFHYKLKLARLPSVAEDEDKLCLHLEFFNLGRTYVSDPFNDDIGPTNLFNIWYDLAEEYAPDKENWKSGRVFVMAIERASMPFEVDEVRKLDTSELTYDKDILILLLPPQYKEPIEKLEKLPSLELRMTENPHPGDDERYVFMMYIDKNDPISVNVETDTKLWNYNQPPKSWVQVAIFSLILSYALKKARV